MKNGPKAKRSWTHGIFDYLRYINLSTADEMPKIPSEMIVVRAPFKFQPSEHAAETGGQRHCQHGPEL